MRKMDRNDSLDFLRGGAIVGVVFIHSYFPSKMSEETLNLVSNLQLFFNWSVIAFFYSSGYFSGWHLNKKIVKKLAVKLIFPCIIFSCIYTFLKLGAFYSGSISNTSISYILKNSIPMAPQFYFLIYLFLVVVVSQAFNFWLVLCCSIIACLLSPIPVYLFGSDLNLIPLYFLSYSFGFASKEKYGFFLIFSVALLLSIFKSNELYLFLVVPSLLVFIGRVLKNDIIRPVAYLGRKSLAIYILHTPIMLPLIMKVMSKYSEDSLVNLLVSVTLTVLLSITIYEAYKASVKKYEKNRRVM